MRIRLRVIRVNLLVFRLILKTYLIAKDYHYYSLSVKYLIDLWYQNKSALKKSKTTGITCSFFSK